MSGNEPQEGVSAVETTARVDNTMVTIGGSDVISEPVDQFNTLSVQPLVITPSSDWLLPVHTDESSSATASAQGKSPNENVPCPGPAENEVAATGETAMQWSTDANVIVIKPEPNTGSERKSSGNGIRILLELHTTWVKCAP